MIGVTSSVFAAEYPRGAPHRGLGIADACKLYAGATLVSRDRGEVLKCTL
jgi:hypothetical protein